MELDQDDKRIPPNSYGPPPTVQQHRMQSSDSGSHNNYPPPSSSGSNYGAGPMGWAPPPSPFANEARHTSEVSQHSNSYPPPSRENTYAAEVPYGSRAGSLSAPTRSPGDGNVQAQLQHVNGTNPDSHYQSQPGPPDYRSRGGYVPPDVPPNGSHSTGLHIATGQEVMPGHQPYPQTPHGPYSHPQSAGPGPGPSPLYEPYYQAQHWSNSSVHRKKPVRAQQACDSCRTRKAKCDEARPCSHCKDNNLSCTYRDIPPHKQDRNALALEAKFDTMQREMGSMQRDIGSMQRETNEKLNRLLQVCESQQNDIRLLGEGLSPDKRAGMSTTLQSPTMWKSSQAPAAQLQYGYRSMTYPSDVALDSEAKNTLPHGHTTAAQNLLLWPSIASFGLEPNPDYVMTEEQNRGLLRLYGRGEGHDKMDSSQGPASPANSSSSSRTEDSASPPAESLWGYGFRPPYPSNHGPYGDHPGGLNADGSPNYASDLVDKYFESYMSHMYILHPFLDKKTIKDHVNQFKSRYSRDRPRLPQKRKREENNSPASAQEPYGPSATIHTIGVERSVRNAIVLLVLALGKICDHKAPLPASPPASYTASVRTSAPTPRSSNSDILSPTPASPYQPLGTKARPLVANASDRREPERTNVDVIPGLAYYDVACDILGGLRGGYDLSHVQAALLGGLYMGQLAQVIASHDWITQAGKACQVLINPKKFPAQGNKKYLDLVKYAYWSCLQLESDILAELPLPQSGISRHENLMNEHLPSGIVFSDEEHVVYQTDENVKAIEVKYYWSQIQLRITLNSIHQQLYKDTPTLQLKVQNTLMDNLELWRIIMLQRDPQLGWDDNDYMTSDINAARMRAKYYGAKVIINRPTLYAALHDDWSTISIRQSESPLPSQGRISQQPSPAIPYKYHATGVQRQDSLVDSPCQPVARSIDRLRPEIYNGVKACIHAAIRSTTAFDGVPSRLIVTNIFGTGHAQFGNMLILSAAYNSYLRPCIDGNQLKGLFARTIDFLRKSADISPSLKRDMQQLKRLEAQLFPRPAPGMNSSFSSADT